MFHQLRWLYRAWHYRLRVEKQEIAWLRECLAPGHVALDVGAHKGAFTYWMGRIVGAWGAVFAFEPQPELAERLAANVRRAGWSHVHVENVGLSSRTGELILTVPSSRPSPGATLEARGAVEASWQSYSVRVATLDEYFGLTRGYGARWPARPIQFIKCDVEGHELEVLRGAECLLRRYHPHLLLECELRHRASGRIDDVFAYLENLGYHGRFYVRGRSYGLEQFNARRHQADPQDRDYVNNFLFRASQRSSSRQAA